MSRLINSPELPNKLRFTQSVEPPPYVRGQYVEKSAYGTTAIPQIPKNMSTAMWAEAIALAVGRQLSALQRRVERLETFQKGRTAERIAAASAMRSVRRAKP